MSGIGGVFQMDGRPADRGLLERMRDVIDFRGPDGSGIWINGNVGLVHRLLWTTEESVYEKQPMTNGRGLWITADCRIDNRDELKREFQSREIWHGLAPMLGLEPRRYPDCAYLLLAYELWGEEAPHHLLGDFAFAIWDEPRRRLFCARDPIGFKPFLYHWDGRKFLFGSEAKQIFQDPAVPEGINLPHLAEILALSFSDREETPYRAVRRLAPACSLALSREGLGIQRYWRWHPDAQPKPPSTLKENSETFRGLFEEAVRCRLRVPAGLKAGSLLSGGLDSSSIASFAASILMAAQNEKATPFPVFTLHFPEADPSYRLRPYDPVDESLYSRAVIERYGLQAHAVEIKGWGPLANLEENLWHQEAPLFFPNLAYFCHLFRAGEKLGVRALFHGEGGDELFSLGGQHLLETLLKRGRWIEFSSEWMAKRRKRGASLRGLGDAILRGLIPEVVKAPYRRFFKRAFPEWMDPGFAKEIGLMKRTTKDFRWDPHSQRSSNYGILNWMFGGHIPLYLEALDRASAWARLEVRYPFLDLRLLHLAAGLPWHQKARGGETKVLLRAACADYLPPPVLHRWRKTEFTPVVRTGLERYGLEIARETFQDPHPILKSMTDSRKMRVLRQILIPERRTSRRCVKNPALLWNLWYLINVDQWLKHERKWLKRARESLTHEATESNPRQTEKPYPVR